MIERSQNTGKLVFKLLRFVRFYAGSINLVNL